MQTAELAQTNQAGVKEEAAEHRQGQQTGWRSAGVQLLTGASFSHKQGQQCHKEQELEVSQSCHHLNTNIKQSLKHF